MEARARSRPFWHNQPRSPSPLRRTAPYHSTSFLSSASSMSSSTASSTDSGGSAEPPFIPLPPSALEIKQSSSVPVAFSLSVPPLSRSRSPQPSVVPAPAPMDMDLPLRPARLVRMDALGREISPDAPLFSAPASASVGDRTTRASRAVLYMNDSVIVGDFNTIFGNGNKVTGRAVSVHGDRNDIIGDMAFAAGNHCSIQGNHATVRGKHNLVTGSVSDVQGDHNFIDTRNGYIQGDYNTIAGNRCRVNGNHNYVYGLHAEVLGTDNTVATPEDSPESSSETLASMSSGSASMPIPFQTVSHPVAPPPGPPFPPYPLQIPPRHVYSYSFLPTLPGAVDLPPAEEEPAAAEGQKTCVVCYDHAAKVALVPCGHANLCVACSRRIVLEGDVKCPVCKARISKVMKFYQ